MTTRSRLLPLLFACYIAAFLDRVNVSFAALQMSKDLGFSDAVYGFGAGVFFVSYALLEIPSNLMLARIGARRWIARIMITWGVLASLMMFVHSPVGFYSLRFLLGAAEAGFFPGIIYYLSDWFPARDRARAIAGFMVAIPISSVLGGPIAGALLALDGRMGLAGWQWLFLVEGLPAVLLGIAVLVYLPDRIEQATWLTPQERSELSAQLAREKATMGDPKSGNAWRAFREPVIWWLIIAWSVVAFNGYAILLWIPQIIKSFSGQRDWVVALLSALPAAASALAMWAAGRSSDRSRERPAHVAVSLMISAASFMALATAPTPLLKFIALCTVSAAMYACHPPFWALVSSLLAGEAAAAGIALVNAAAQVGSFAGPALMGVLKERTGSFTASLYLGAALALVAAVVMVGVKSAVGAHGESAQTA